MNGHYKKGYGLRVEKGDCNNYTKMKTIHLIFKA